jgi:hypothetical protein
MDINIRESFRYLYECVDVLDNAATVFAAMLPLPVYTSEMGGAFRLIQRDEKTFSLLRCIRIVSGLRAELGLIEQGFCQEAGVIHRTILEFSHDLDFVVDGLINPESKSRMQERMAKYFVESPPAPEDFMSRPKKSHSFLREKVYAAVLRLLGGNNPYRIRQIAKTLEEVYSGYVHGNYRHVMEMYNGAEKGFKTKGTPGRIPEWVQNVALIVQPVLNQFSTIASAFGLNELMNQLKKKSDELEAHPIYSQNP